MPNHELKTARDLRVLLDVSNDSGPPVAHLRLVVSSDPHNVGRTLLCIGDEVIVGRDVVAPGSNRAFCNDELMSRRHFVITRTGRTYQIVDAGSTNGTFLAGRRLVPHRPINLLSGSVIRTGNSLFVFNIAEPAMEPWDHPILPGFSPALCTARDWLLRIVPLSLPVLILGETGTGKEHVALGIHEAGGTARGPFVAVNCGELERSLARSELFGAIRGAYTGATESRAGLVADANNGTLFLDELGELDLDVQKSLLRFLQDGSYRPVGGTAERRSNARIVAATNRDLDHAVRENRFREDLLARLRSVEPVQLPALRNRREDIFYWSRKLLSEIRDQMGVRTPTTRDIDVDEALLLDPWPRNLRELRETLLSAVLRADGGNAITLRHLPETLQKRFHQRRIDEDIDAAPTASAGGSGAPKSLDASQQEEWGQITQALAENDGNVSKAADTLGKNRRWLYRRAQSLGIHIDEFRTVSDDVGAPDS